MSDEKHPRISARAIQRYSTLDDPSFVRLCYNAILDREPDSHGMEIQLGALRKGHSRPDVIEGLFGSPEFDLRDPDRTTVKTREAFFDAGGYLDPTVRNLLNSVARRIEGKKISF